MRKAPRCARRFASGGSKTLQMCAKHLAALGALLRVVLSSALYAFKRALQAPNEPKTMSTYRKCHLQTFVSKQYGTQNAQIGLKNRLSYLFSLVGGKLLLRQRPTKQRFRTFCVSSNTLCAPPMNPKPCLHTLVVISRHLSLSNMAPKMPRWASKIDFHSHFP